MGTPHRNEFGSKDKPKEIRRVTIFLHTFGFATGSIGSIKTKGRNFPIHSNYLIDARELPEVRRDSIYHDVALSNLDGRYQEVQDYIDRLGDLRRLVHREAKCLSLKISEWTRWNRINIAIGSKWGRHRSVAVQQMIVDVLRAELSELGIEPSFRFTYFGFTPEPLIEMPHDRIETSCG